MTIKFNVLSVHNRKLDKDGIVSINMPPLLTCPSAGDCKKYCYAQVGQQAMGAAKALRLRNFKLFSEDPTKFEEMAMQDIKLSGRRIIRWLDSGDILNTSFLKMMVRVARAFKEVKFYTYTKSISIIIRVGWKNLPINLKLIQSYGGLEDHLIDKTKPFAKVFRTKEDIPKNFIDASYSDYASATTAKKIGLVVHGCRKRKF